MVSVALCTHNGAEFLGAQLHSILNQTRVPDEIVISDDASTDATLSLALEIFGDRTAPALTVMQNSTALGVTANFAQALAACSGDLLALCDQDDVWSPVKMEQMLAEFAGRPGLLLLHSDARLVGQDGEPMGATLFGALSLSAEEKRSVHQGIAFSVLLRRNIVTGATAMLRRELLERAEPFPASWVHDEWLAMIAAATGEMDMLEAPLIDYRQHGRNEIGVSSLTLRIGINRLRVSRADRNARLLNRAQSLADRVESSGFALTESDAQAIEEKLCHERIRSGLPASRARRLRPVVAEWSTGRYARYGLGLQDIVRDLTQPA
ncbi:glycosyltransferase involved in cell wall biosynthesis [Cryobacterium psychrophilum]|uniref:Glycosyltransferase family 2 protein n=2 Tax=Cryobacterium psychrophilum TaxID=41988 RepID=A0A4Y8KLS0_9MICO|nr:glycosyltransferase involved in cell wall biosynthesis [Cryobacterium psychrophilum]TFD76625.1 glycosyltransferase family 2 protein [Cryobacterium psychrophilum]